jgi:hypothetical protein
MQASDRALSRVPIEVWREIFELVTLFPRQCEFTKDGAAYVLANEASRAETGIPTSKEEDEITESRFSIIRVCKLWYSIGIRALWSHLRIDVCTEPIRAIEGIQGAINRDISIASYVIRITLEESRRKTAVTSGVLDGLLQRLTSQLPSLQIFVCPGIYACGMAKSSIDIVVWTRPTYPDVFHRVLKQTTYIQNARVLSISLRANNLVQFNWEPVLFPRLESLYLQVHSLQIINKLTRDWEIPNLRILSINSISATYWLDFIEKWGTNMDILELSNTNSEWPRSIQLPNLKELRVDEVLWRSYRLAAPKLERLCLLSFHGYAHVRYNVIKAVDHARASFPALRRVQLCGKRRDSSLAGLFDFSLINLDIRSWTEAGLEVDVLSY